MPNHPNTVLFSEWRGLNNKSPSERIAENFLTEATNIDIDAAGSIRMRRGYTQQIAGTDAHSLWSDGDKEAYYVESGTLYRIDPNDTTKRTSITTGLSDSRLSYIKIDGKVYFNNIRGDSGVIENNTVRSWGLDTPRISPFLSVISGQLTAGDYSVAVRYRDVNGRVSGTGPQGLITVPSDNSGLLVSGLETPADASVTHVELFISTPNGEVLYYHSSVPSGTSSTTVTSLYGNMVPLEYQFVFPAPPGEMMQLYNGRIYMAYENRLWYSEPHAYEHFNWAGWIEFHEDITNIMPVDDGIFITADQLYFLEGREPTTFNMREREIYKAAKYTGVAIVGGDILMENIPTGLKWLFTSNKGIVMLGTGGLVFNLTERNVMVANAEEGAAIFKSKDGMNQYVSLLKNPNEQRMHFGDSATADVIRNGILIT